MWIQKLSISVLALAFCAASFGAEAADPNPKAGKWYFTGSGGYLMPQNADGNDPAAGSFTVEYDGGMYLSGALGYYVARTIRLEGELSYGQMAHSNLSVAGTSVALTGDIDLYSAMGGVYFDMLRSSNGGFYLGGGGGVLSWDHGDQTATVNGTTYRYQGDSGNTWTAFGEIGADYNLSNNMAIVPAYRYQWLDTGNSYREDNVVHIFKVGLRYDLN